MREDREINGREQTVVKEIASLGDMENIPEETKIFPRHSTQDVMIWTWIHDMWIEAESDEDHCPRNGISKWKNRRRGRLGEEEGGNMAPWIVSNVEPIRGLKRRVRSMVHGGTNERKRKRTSGEKGRGLSGEEERSVP